MYDWLIEQIGRFRDNQRVLLIISLAVSLVIALLGYESQVPPVITETPTPTLTATMTPTVTATPTVTPTPTIQPAGAVYFIAPNGLATNSGSISSPWDIKTGLDSKASVIKPGSTVYLRAGTYKYVSAVKLQGAAGNYVIIRPYQNEAARIEGGVMIYNPYVEIRDLEFFIPYTSGRTSAQITSHPTDLNVTAGVTVLASHIRVINNWIHDTGQGIVVHPLIGDAYVYGNLVYNNGWMAPDRGHGHGVYPQNETDMPDLFEANIVFNQFSTYNFHLYREGGIVKNITLIDNVTFNGTDLVGGYYPFSAITIQNHYAGAGMLRLGYRNQANLDFTLTDSILDKLSIEYWQTGQVTGTRYSSLNLIGSPGVTFSGGGIQSGYIERYIVNKYNGRKIFVFFNPERRAVIQLDGVYSIRAAQNPTVSKVGSEIVLSEWAAVAKPNGYAALYSSTLPEFGVFILE
jgi:hypothetical protein